METKVCFVGLQIIIYVDQNQNQAEFILSDERFDPKTYFLCCAPFEMVTTRSVLTKRWVPCTYTRTV